MRKNYIFIHAAYLIGCEERLCQYMSLIKSSGLLNDVERVNINIIGEPPILDFGPKVHVTNLSRDLTTSEQTTLDTMYDFCRETPGCNVLYIHTKGVGKERNECIEDWINYMCYFLIEKYKTFIHCLGEYSTIGVDLLSWPALHYSGNFWWATSEHISTLHDSHTLLSLPNVLNSPRHNYEFWICSDGYSPRHACIHQSGINCLERHLHRYLRLKYAN